jgi:hypothetical protein
MKFRITGERKGGGISGMQQAPESMDKTMNA